MIRDTSGNLYGTTPYGGASGLGVVFTVSAAGQLTILHNFAGGNDGATPNAALVPDSAGNLYGMTSGGGFANAGVVFKLDKAGNETLLHTFTGGADGGSPNGSLAFDPAGNIYGTTYSGGTQLVGVAFKLTPAGTETVLYNFQNQGPGVNGGYFPAGGVALDSSNNLYGTTQYGGSVDCGVVFKVDTSGHESAIYTFNGTDGGAPWSGVIRDTAGNLYGTAQAGGAAGQGVVFKVTPAGSETTLYSFTGGADGGQPYSGVIRDSAGNLYGTTQAGGAGQGVIFKLSAAGVETPLHSFGSGSDGAQPYIAGVIRDSAGNLYGTTSAGGTTGAGVVYKLSSAGVETVLVNFGGSSDGGAPEAAPIRDASGNFYGTTYTGGINGFGTVYKVTPEGHETLLHTFTGTDGDNPFGGLVRDASGNLYGTTYKGGAHGLGTVYKLDTANKETTIHNFTGGADGSYPYYGSLVFDTAGNLYGTTWKGGTAGFGVVFKLDPTGNETVLYNFTGGADGGNPQAGVVRDSAGNLYGTASTGGAENGGVVYKLDTTGHQTVIHNFSYFTEGGQPTAGVIRDLAGNLFGTTNSGGASFAGTVYKLSATGQLTVLHSFSYNTGDGSIPFAGVTLDPGGNLYGTTLLGGTYGQGVVYEITAAGGYSLLYSFSGEAAGGIVFAGVIRDASGNLYGATANGGARYGGTLFKLTP